MLDTAPVCRYRAVGAAGRVPARPYYPAVPAWQGPRGARERGGLSVSGIVAGRRTACIPIQEQEEWPPAPQTMRAPPWEEGGALWRSRRREGRLLVLARGHGPERSCTARRRGDGRHLVRPERRPTLSRRPTCSNRAPPAPGQVWSNCRETIRPEGAPPIPHQCSTGEGLLSSSRQQHRRTRAAIRRHVGLRTGYLFLDSIHRAGAGPATRNRGRGRQKRPGRCWLGNLDDRPLPE